MSLPDPHPWQRECGELLSERVRRPTEPGIVQAVTGCHAAGQGILMFDGSIKKVEDVIVGDLLMGLDSRPRRVLRLCRGEQEMVDIVPVKGKPWRVNLDHVLTLVNLVDGRLQDVSVRTWLTWDYGAQAHWCLLRGLEDDLPFRCWAEIEFTVAPTGRIEPFYGFTLDGDGRYLLDDFTVTHNSGKSFTQGQLTRLLVSTLPKDRITFVATSRRVLVEQLFEDISPHVGKQFLGTFYGDGKKFLGKRAIFTTYKSLFKCVEAVQRAGGKLGSIILDEAHNTGAEALNEWLCERAEGGLKHLFGFTATDFRGNPKERLEWCSERIYSYPYARAVADKVIVPHVLKTRAGGVASTDEDILQMIVETDALRYGAGLVTAADISDAEHFAKVLSDAGIIARHVASDLGRGIIPEVENQFAKGSLLAITSPRLVSEGYDYPPLKWLCFRAPLSKEGGRVLAIQTVGRVLRRVRAHRFPREVQRWGSMEEALILDPRNKFVEIGLNHEPALGYNEEEPEPPLKVRTDETLSEGVMERRPDLLADVPMPVAWAYALLAWVQQGPAVCPIAAVKSESRARPDRTPSAVSPVQARFAIEARRVLRTIARLNEPHRTHLFEGLDLVIRWAESDEGLGRWRAAAAILQAADTLIGWFGTPLFHRGQTLIIPDKVTPYTSSTPPDM